jgi:hypothetical protein
VKAPGEKQSPDDSPSPARDPLVAELAKAESDLERIEAQRIAAKARIDSLRNELAALDATPRPVVPEPLPGLVPHTPADKVKLFRQLFRGRPDLYPTRYEGPMRRAYDAHRSPCSISFSSASRSALARSGSWALISVGSNPGVS